MSKLKPYPKYKDSGIEWIGEVPEGWKVVPFFVAANEKSASNRGMIEDNLLSLSYGNIVRRNINTNEGLLPESFETYQIVDKDNIVFRLTDLQNDQRSLRNAIVKERGIITSAYIAVVIKDAWHPDYYNYLFRAYDTIKVFYGMGAGLRQSLKYDDLKRIPVLLPHYSEQQAIAAYLDRETAQIDALITKKTRSIELLREKRQAMITHAVTKGLDPNAKMKDSGIEWIGEVPEGWKTNRVYSLFNETALRGGSKDRLLTVTQTQGIMPQSMYQESTGKRLSQQMSEDYSNYKQVQKNDFVYNKMRMWQGAIGVSAYDGCVSPAYITMRNKKDITPAYWSRLFTTPPFLIEVNRGSQGICDDQNSCTFDKFREILVPIPPLPEQQAIAAYLDRETAQIDALITKKTRSIELLREKRQTLITAAVTGKIDVRPLAREIVPEAAC